MLFLNSSFTTSITYALALALISYLSWQWLLLSRIPGPFLAKFTNIPRAYWVFTRRAHDIHIRLHEKYGKLVRFGPNMVSVGDALEIEKIYRMHNPLMKVRTYLTGRTRRSSLAIVLMDKFLVRLLPCDTSYVQR